MPLTSPLHLAAALDGPAGPDALTAAYWTGLPEGAPAPFARTGPQTAIACLEQVWGRDLSGYDPDGPLPEVDPDTGEGVARGRAARGDRLEQAARWRAVAHEKKLSIRELVIEVTGRQSFIGTPAEVAEQINSFVQNDARDHLGLAVPHPEVPA